MILPRTLAVEDHSRRTLNDVALAPVKIVMSIRYPIKRSVLQIAGIEVREIEADKIINV